MQLYDLIQEKKVALHRYDVRSDIAQLKQLLHPEFLEIGYSGKVYDFQSITEVLLEEAKPTHTVLAKGFEFKELSPSVMLLTYQSARQEQGGEISRHAMRSSVWVREAGE